MYRSLTPRVTRRQLSLTIKAVILFAIVAVLLTASMPAVERQLTNWKLLPESQPLAELYFTNPEHLPTLYQPNQGLMTQFVIVNHNQPSGTYDYAITESNAQLTDTKSLTVGSIHIDHNDSVTLTKTIMPIDLGSRVYIRVLVNNVTVGYWVRQG